MPKNRLEAFSDGVIAIVITLLVLEIHVPPNPLVTNQEMLNAILKLAPHLLAYVISFLVCAVWWVAHHALIHDLRQVDTALLWANNLFLLGLAFLPFPTALLGQHPAQPIAAAFYGVVGAFTGLCFGFMRWYATVPGRLMNPELDLLQLRRRIRISVVSPLLYLAGAAAGLVAPAVSLLIYAAIPCYFAYLNLRQSAVVSKRHTSRPDA